MVKFSILQLDFKYKHLRQFSYCANLRAEDKDFDLSDQKNKHKATSNENTQEQGQDLYISREDRRKELIELLGEYTQTIEEILDEEFGQEYNYEIDSDEENDIANRRNRYDNYTPEQKIALDRAKEEYINIISTLDGNSILSDKLRDISKQSSTALDEIGENPKNTDAISKADLLGDLFEIYKYGPDKFDADRGLNEYQNKLDENKKKDPDDPEDPDLGGGSVSSSSSDIGEGPSGTSDNTGSSAQKDYLS
jgi:hypothetical protein